jgi:hypothetical protein
MKKGIDRFASQINRQRASKELSMRFGTITAVTGTTVTVQIGGAAITAINRLASYSPTVNDKVAILRSGATMVVLGEIA